jgi:hypothetical protein
MGLEGVGHHRIFIPNLHLHHRVVLAYPCEQSSNRRLLLRPILRLWGSDAQCDSDALWRFDAAILISKQC